MQTLTFFGVYTCRVAHCVKLSHYMIVRTEGVSLLETWQTAATTTLGFSTGKWEPYRATLGTLIAAEKHKSDKTQGVGCAKKPLTQCST